MAKRKWYVVIVGKNIGVFTTWAEAGPLVKGVSNAIHQSFHSEEEARSAFCLAYSKGDTRIVDGDQRSTSTSPTFSSGSSTSSRSHSNGSFSSLPTAKALSTPFTPHRPQATNHGSPNSERSFKSGSGSNLHPVSYIFSEPTHSSNHSTTNCQHYNNDEKPTEIVPVETQVVKEDTRVSTPQSDPIGLSPTLKPPSRRRAIVKTPSWLASYPKSPQPLSPLDSLSLNNFRTGALNNSDQKINFKPSSLANSDSPSSSSMYCTHSPRTSTILPQSNGSVSDTSVFFSSAVRRVHVVYEKDKDPRSPILSQAKVPVSGLNYTFTRPSPSLRLGRLSAGLHGFEAPSSSLLFHPSRCAVHQEDGGVGFSGLAN